MLITYVWLGVNPRPPRPIRHSTMSLYIAGSYSEAVQGSINYALPHFPPPFLDSSLESQGSFKLNNDVHRVHQVGYLRWTPNVTVEKMSSPMPRLGIEPRPPGPHQTLYHVAVKAGSYSEAIQVSTTNKQSMYTLTRQP